MSDKGSEESKRLIPEFDPDDSQEYRGICQCGSIQFSVELSPPLEKQQVVSCNCSICLRNGYLLVYPYRKYFTLKSGEDALKSYSFGRKRNSHKFCANCGSSAFFDPQLQGREDAPDILGVNVRMFKDVNLDELHLIHFDGKNKYPFIDSDHLK